MKVLHVHQIAHIPQLLVERLNAEGFKADFLEEVRPADVKGSDLVHGHYALNRHTIKAFRLARKYGVPFILHCHGSDLRLLTGTGRKGLPFHYRVLSEHIRSRSDAIILSTPDLIKFEPRGKYIPNPVNLERFRPMPGIQKSASHLICGKQVKGSRLLDFIKPEIQYDCVNAGHPFKFPQNVRVLPLVDYAGFPEFLNGYREMIGTVGDVISMARLEAMACGLRTFTDFDPAFTKFYDGRSPDKTDDPRGFIKRFHDPQISVAGIIKVYDGIGRP